MEYAYWVSEYSSPSGLFLIGKELVYLC